MNGYIGCYLDSSTLNRRDLRYRQHIETAPVNNSIMSVDWCRGKCNNYPYFGIQKNENTNIYECRCDYNYGGTSGGVQVNHEICDHPCPGNANQLCGGPRTNAIYHTDVPTTVEDSSVGFSVEYPMGLGNVPIITQKYCHFVTETNPLLPYAAVNYLKLKAMSLQQPFMLYKMNNCLQGNWDKVYNSEMFYCLSRNEVQDPDATANVPSAFPDFTGRAGGRTPTYPTCSRIHSPSSVANLHSPCIPFQRIVPLNTTVDGLIPPTTTSTGTTYGYEHPTSVTNQVSAGYINSSWNIHTYVNNINIIPTGEPSSYLHLIDINGLLAQTTYSFALSATNTIPLTSEMGDESYPVTTANPNPPDAPSSVPTPTGYGPYFINLTWNTPFSDGGRVIHPSNYVIKYNTSSDATVVTVSSNDVTIHNPINIDNTLINKQYVATIIGLIHSTTYHFIVVPGNALGLGTPSIASQSATTLSSSEPGIPDFQLGTSLGASSTLSITSDQVYVEWRLINTGGLVCTFNIQLVDLVDWSSGQNKTDVSDSSVRFTNLMASRNYLMYVTAKNSVGVGYRSNAISFTTLAPTVPGDLSNQVSIINSTSESVFVNWVEPINRGGLPIIGYKLEVEEVNNKFTQIIQIKTNTYVTDLDHNFTFRIKKYPGSTIETACMSFNVSENDLKLELQRVFSPIVYHPGLSVEKLNIYNSTTKTNFYRVSSNNITRIDGDGEKRSSIVAAVLLLLLLLLLLYYFYDYYFIVL